jgi:hypothetical protein
MAFSKAFEKELNNLFEQRTYWLRQKLGTTGAGKPPGFDRKKVKSGIRKLQEIASHALAGKLAKAEFKKYVTSRRRNYRVKGWGVEDKKARFGAWFERFSKRKGLIYVFWSGRRCVYVGRTGSRGVRPSSHFDKAWFTPVTRVTIFDVSRKSHIPKLECLAIHHFQPSQNKNKAAKGKWTKACPLCTTHMYIRDELHNIFRFK